MEKGLLAMALSVAIVFQGVGIPTKAHAAVCSVHGGQSGSLKYSSQLTTVSATVCGDQIWKLLGKPRKPTKPVRPTKPKKYAHNFTVVPDRPQISATEKLLVGEPGTFSGLSTRHIRNRMLFWYPSQVKFSPREFRWIFGDGATAMGKNTSHAWSSSGLFTIRLTVGFSVKYRIIGRTNWVQIPGLVYASSMAKVVTVGTQPDKPGGRVELVHWLCTQKANAIGC